MLIITLPMCVMLFMLSNEAYSIFYGSSKYGSLILKFSALSHILFGLWTVLNTSLQSLKKFKIIYMNSAIGLACNAMLDIPMILLLNKLGLPAYIGTILATCIGYIISITIVLVHLKKTMKFNYKSVLNVLKRLIIPVIVVLVLLIISKHYILIKYTRLNSLISILIHGFVGVIIYLLITYKNKALTDVLGEEFVNKLLVKAHLKKRMN